ncbi:MAG: putative small multi-drug export protein [Chloroflexi bacterium]|nr:MAG: putative small multi-drug export protein [Chloroflexota bacterium]
MYQYLIVAATAASPIGELVIAIPVGLALSLSPFWVALTAIVFNMLPVLAISFMFSRAEGSQGPLRWLTRFRKDRVARVVGRYGLPGVLVLTPLLGTWAVTATLEAVGVSRIRILGTMLLSLLVYSAILLGGNQLFFG